MNFLAQPAPNGCFLPVVYEDDHLLIFNKTAGTHSTPLSAQETDSAVNAALAHLPQLSKLTNRPSEPGLLHRLDQGTSGLLIFAKTQTDYEAIRKNWKTPSFKKIYRAWVIGHEPLIELPQEIDTPIGHSAKSAKKMIAIRSQSHLKQIRAKPQKALTRILKVHSETKVSSPHPFPLLYDLEIEILTGVRHQIRCHLAHLGFPILGDPLYGSTQDKELSKQYGTRMFLHSWRVEIPFPKYLLKVEAQIPETWAPHSLL